MGTENTANPIGGAILGGAMGIGASALGSAMQMSNQNTLNAMGVENSKELMDYQNAKQLEMWRDTNYSAQMKELKKAGLNASLIYGKGGAGGQLGGSMPSQNGGKADNNAATIGQMAGMGIQAQLLEAQKENIEADTKNKIAQATKTSGVDTTKAMEEIELIKNNSALSAQEKLNKIQEVIESQARTENLIGKTAQQPHETAVMDAQAKKLGEESKTIEELRKPTIDRLKAETNSIGKDIVRKEIENGNLNEIQQTALAEAYWRMTNQVKEGTKKDLENELSKIELNLNKIGLTKNNSPFMKWLFNNEGVDKAPRSAPTNYIDWLFPEGTKK